MDGIYHVTKISKQVYADRNVEIRLLPNYEINKVFTDPQVDLLKNYFKRCAVLFCGLSAKDCHQVAYQMAKINSITMPPKWNDNQMAGLEWLRSFRSRHPDLEKVITRNPVFADGTTFFNLDETGTTAVQKLQRIGGSKGHKNYKW